MPFGQSFELTPRLLAVVAAIGVLSAAAPALAQDDDGAGYEDATEDVRFDDEFVDNEYQLVGRFRTVGIPSFLLNAFWDRHSGNWVDGQTNFAYGLEFVWRKVDAFELSVAAEYADLRMPDDWWVQRGDPDSAAEFTEFKLGLASLVFSGYWYWDVNDWLSPYLGGGLGPAIVLGEVTNYDPNPESNCKRNLGTSGGGFGSSKCFSDSGEPNTNEMNRKIEEGVPPVAAVVNLTTGLRFNIQRNGVVKLEVGFYDYLYAGLSAGAQWR